MTQFISSTDPSLNINNHVQAFDEWDNPDDGNMYFRESTNSDWTLVGNVDQDRLGLAPTSGFFASGEIEGVSSWAPLDSPDFQTSATIDGIEIATINDVTNLNNSLMALINAKVSSAINAYLAQASSSSRIAMKMGSLLFSADQSVSVPQTIPLPIFASDGVVALESQCAWVVSFYQFPIDDNVVSYKVDTMYFDDGNSHIIDPSTTRTFRACAGGGSSSGFASHSIGVNYIIIGIR